jgi:hypothetical protein
MRSVHGGLDGGVDLGGELGCTGSFEHVEEAIGLLRSAASTTRDNPNPARRDRPAEGLPSDQRHCRATPAAPSNASVGRRVGVAPRGWDTPNLEGEEANERDQGAVASAACSISFTRRAL